MVIISATIWDKKGKILVARQFVEVSKLKMEEYITFPNLFESGNSNDLIWYRKSMNSCRNRCS